MSRVAIIGGGLAGVTLAWRLHERGVDFRLYDRGELVTSSRIAAGLLTPITGKRPTLSWRWNELAPVAFGFYKSLEKQTGARFFHPGPMVRIFVSPEEQAETLRRTPSVAGEPVRVEATPLDTNDFYTPHGAAIVPGAARLDVKTYLDASIAFFRDLGCYETREVGCASDIALSLGATHVIFCQGFAANPLFPQVRFAASKGEILTLRIPGLTERRTVNRHGQWLTHITGDIYRAGSTYDHDCLDNTPTEAGRDRILAALAGYLKRPVEVVEHFAAVRPIIHVSRPVVAMHPTLPHLGFFNGLGSKGSLTAPYFANHLVEHILDGTPLEADLGLEDTLPERRR
jgi:glycine oxidase